MTFAWRSCGLLLGVRGGELVRIRGDKDHPVNMGSLCVKGRFGLDFVSAEDRLTKPLIRKDGSLQEKLAIFTKQIIID